MKTFVRGGLASTGWIDWADLRAVLGDDECFWVDLGGAHYGRAPARLPVGATHLWSWRPQRWARVRFDRDRALATVLSAGGSRHDKDVTALVSDGLPWGRHSRAADWENRVTLVVTEGSAPITFMEVHPAPNGPL